MTDFVRRGPFSPVRREKAGFLMSCLPHMNIICGLVGLCLPIVLISPLKQLFLGKLLAFYRCCAEGCGFKYSNGHFSVSQNKNKKNYHFYSSL